METKSNSPTNNVTKLTTSKALKLLKGIFLRNGYLRKSNELKQRIFGSQKYKKGYEVRLVTKNQEELDQVQAALSALDLKVAKTFLKAKQIVQPVYGKDFYKKMEKIKIKAEKEGK